MGLPQPRITEARYWSQMREDHRVRGLKAQRGISFERLFRELAEVAVGLRAEAGQVDRVITAYRREHGLTSEQIRERRATAGWLPPSPWAPGARLRSSASRQSEWGPDRWPRRRSRW